MTNYIKSFDNFEVKELIEEKRTFRGIATTPTQDRVKDILVSTGAKFQLPMPLLMHHDSRLPVGQVTSAKVTQQGVEVEIHFPEIPEEGNLKARVEEAYQSVKYNLIRGLSVGFIPNWDDAEMIKGGGVQFNEYEIYELSLTPTPCNSDAGISYEKAFEEHKAALGKKPQDVPGGASSEQKHVVVKLNSPTKGGVKL